MAVEMTGAEWDLFYNDNNVWRDYGCHEAETLIVDGKEYNSCFEDIKPTAKVQLIGGLFYKDMYDVTEIPQDLETIFLEWQKSRDA